MAYENKLKVLSTLRLSKIEWIRISIIFSLKINLKKKF
jgi:hypothetical protein